MKAGDALCDYPRNLRWRQLTVGRQDPVTVFVEFSDDARAHVFAPIVKLLLELVLDDCTLFLHHEDLFEPLSEVPDPFALKRPGHCHLVETHTDLGGMGVVDPEIV